MITRFADFLEACRGATRDQIYEIFEDRISENLYVQIMSHVQNEEDPEPVRDALRHIGSVHDIQSLIDY